MSPILPQLSFCFQIVRKYVHDLASIAPMISGVIAPLAVLYDIPALSEKWYTRDGVPLPDFMASLVLSGISLTTAIIANALLIIRFSLTSHRWRIATRVSIIFWAIKLGVSLANLIVFGAMRRSGHGYAYAEGFWCAFLSTILSGMVFFLLLLHWAVVLRTQGDVRTSLQHTVRVTGRHFMLQTTLFVTTVAVMSVIFCFLEQWTYLQSIYFTIVTLLTIGFGDFTPTKTATKILLFPLALCGIAQLGSILSLIVGFFSLRAARRKARSRGLSERQRQMEQDRKQTPPDLLQEIDFLIRSNASHDMKDQLNELLLGVAGLVVFWFVGAAIFTGTEGWSYPTSMYFCYVFFLSIGYGDWAPITPAGRVVFIIYALLAVPIMASFAVTAMQRIVTELSEWRLAKRKVHEGIKNAGAEDSHDVVSHSEYVERHHERWVSRQQRRRHDDVEARTEEETLTELLIGHALELERHARRLLMAHLPNGSKAQIVLKADWIVQLRHVRTLERQGFSSDSQSNDDDRASEFHAGGDDDRDWMSHPLDDDGTVDEIRRYREAFAAFLATGSRLRKLEGAEKYKAERRLGKDETVNDREKPRVEGVALDNNIKASINSTRPRCEELSDKCGRCDDAV